MVTQSRIPGGGGGEGVGDMTVTQSQKKVVAEARDGAGGVRRINEGGGEVMVSGCRGEVAPVTSPEYRECLGGGGGGATINRWRAAARTSPRPRVADRWRAGSERVLPEEEVEGVQDQER
jgi:hypothetical protein